MPYDSIVFRVRGLLAFPILIRNLLARLFQPTRDERSLLSHQLIDLCVVYGRMDVALHEGTTVVVLDVSHPPSRIVRKQGRGT